MSLFLLWCLSLHILGLASAQQPTLTSSLEQDGGLAVCPGEVVTFTCMVTNAGSLRWTALPFITREEVFEFTAQSAPQNGSVMMDGSGQVTAVLTTFVMVGAFGDFTSELRVTAPETLSDEILVQCLSFIPFSSSMSKAFTVIAPPSPPQQPSYSVSQYQLNDFTVAVQWESPASDGGVGIDDYTLTGAGITAPLTVLSNGPLMTTLTLSYNEMHMVSITASNCAGESTASVVTIHKANCGDPPLPKGGSVMAYDNTREGTEIVFQCSPGFVPSQQTMSVCAANGSWTPDPAGLLCRADCGIPVIVDGSVNYTTTVEGSTATYQCDTGLVPEGVMTAMCMENQKWAPDPANAVCRLPSRATCGHPVSPSNGFVDFTDVIEGSEATFWCDSGPEMTAVCTASGEWIPNPGDLDCGTDTDTPSSTTAGTPPSSAPSDQAVVIAVSVVVVMASVPVVVTIIIICICWKKRKSSSTFALKATAPESAPDSTYDYARATTGVSLEMDSLPKNGFYDQPDTKKPPAEKLDNGTYDDPDSMMPPPLPPPPSSTGLIYADLGLAQTRVPPPAPPSDVQYSQIVPQSVPKSVSQSVPIDIDHPADKLLNLDTALAQLKEVQESWYELGTGLGVPVATLDDIKSQCPSSQDCLIETVDSWIRGHTGTPTWRIVTAVLRQINFQRLAVSIDQVYVTGELPTPFDNRVPSSSLGNPSPGGFGTPEGPPPPIPTRMSSHEEAVPPKPPRYRGGQESKTPPLPSRLEPEPAVPPRPPKSSKSAPPRPARRSRRRSRNKEKGDAPPHPPKPAPYHGGQ